MPVVKEVWTIAAVGAETEANCHSGCDMRCVTPFPAPRSRRPAPADARVLDATRGGAQLAECPLSGEHQLVQIGDEIPVPREAPRQRRLIAEQRDTEAERSHQRDMGMDLEH